MNVYRSHPRVARIAVFASVALSAAPVVAQDHLGAFRNVLIQNPYTPSDNQFGRGVAAGDFDGDGIDDLAIAEVGGTRLRVLLGNAWDVEAGPFLPFGPTTVTTPLLSYSITTGDFDGDGRDEIAVGAHNSGVSGFPASGGAYVMDRAVNGAWSVQEEIRTGGSYPGSPQTGASFGNSVAAGDFDDDGFDDLAIGIRGQIVGGEDDAGAVMVTYGSASGIGPTGARIFNRTNDGLGFTPKEDDLYGWSLAAGDFDGDGADDLAIGIFGGACPDATRSGAVVVLRGGSPNGVSNVQSHIWRPGVQGVAGTCASADGFGTALVAGDFDNDDRSDLAISAPRDGDGAVHVLYGSDAGLTADGDQRFVAPALPAGSSSADGRFGSTLAAGRIAYECHFILCTGDSLAIGAPLAMVDGVDHAGAVWVIEAVWGGRLDASTAKAFLPRAPLRIGPPQANMQFGNALAIGDFNDDSRRDLAIGAYLYDEDVGIDAGAVQVLYQSDFLFVDGFDD
jgi:hypothetical protein